jgi:hypothetical protein
MAMLRGDVVMLPHFKDTPYIGVCSGKTKPGKRGMVMVQVIFPSETRWIPSDQLDTTNPDAWANAVKDVMTSGQTSTKQITIGHFAMTGVNKTVEWKSNGDEVTDLIVHNVAKYF